MLCWEERKVFFTEKVDTTHHHHHHSTGMPNNKVLLSARWLGFLISQSSFPYHVTSAFIMMSHGNKLRIYANVL